MHLLPLTLHSIATFVLISPHLMFSLRFFGGFKIQRETLLAATEFADISLHPSVARHLAAISEVPPAHADYGSERIWRAAVRAVQPLLFRSILTNIGAALFALGAVLSSKWLLDYSADLPIVIAMAGLFLLCELANNTCQYFELRRRVQLARGIQMYLFSRINWKLLRLDTTQELALSKGNLKTLIGSDIEAVEDFITAAAANWIPTLVLLAILTPTIYLMSGLLGLVGVTLALVQIPVSVLFASLIEKYQGKTQQHQDGLTTLIGEWVKNIRLVRYLGWQQAIARDIQERVRWFSIDSSMRHLLVCFTYAVSFSWWMAPIVGMLLTASALSIPLQLSSFFLSIWALSHLTNYIQNIPYSIGLLGSALAAETRLNALLSAPELRRHFTLESSAPSDSERPTSLSLENVAIEFGSTTALAIPALSINLTKRTAIVGEVGSGKSLLLEIISAERAPTRGSIVVGYQSGQSRPLWGEYTYRHFRAQIAYSPQQPFLSNTSLRKNIDLGDDLGTDQVKQATRAAQMESDIALFPRAIEEEVGETGINLSGGQKQRVSLARAFASGRPIFILDDPLSAVDRRTEQALVEELLKVSRGLVLVSHRLEELAACDRILVLQAGRVIEDGSPHELITRQNSAFNTFLKAAAHYSTQEEVA
ncbi:MAG: ABC transporter ATP-binding protein [Proteobacteria bacterium]|nr:ABC transporter ATP-binding protein [Pseudomonadota bacterium]